MLLDSTTSPRSCADCAVDISDRHTNARRCVLCAYKYNSEWRLRRGVEPAPRSCLDCAADISMRHCTAYYCVECAVEHARESHRLTQQRRMSNPANREQQRLKMQEKRRDAEYHSSELERRRAYGRNPENHERMMAYSKWYRKLPSSLAKNRQRENKRRALKVSQLGFVTPDVLAMLESATKCAVCNRGFTKRNPKHIDHVVPITKGGLHDNGNLQALCRVCNSSKHARDPIEFARKNGRLL